MLAVVGRQPGISAEAATELGLVPNNGFDICVPSWRARRPVGPHRRRDEPQGRPAALTGRTRIAG